MSFTDIAIILLLLLAGKVGQHRGNRLLAAVNTEGVAHQTGAFFDENNVNNDDFLLLQAISLAILPTSFEGDLEVLTQDTSLIFRANLK